MDLPLADLQYRESATYAEPASCLVCKKLVDSTNPHIFVRDADESLSDDEALVGLLHVDCEQTYIDNSGMRAV